MLHINVQHSNNPEEYAKNFDKAVKQFKKAVANDGFLKEIQDRRYYQKPGEKKRMDENKRQRLFRQLKEGYKKEY